MPIKPTGYPYWASAAGASGIVEPPDAKKSIGWLASERPSAQYFNWLLEKQSAWTRYLSYDRIVSEEFVMGANLLGGTQAAFFAVFGGRLDFATGLAATYSDDEGIGKGNGTMDIVLNSTGYGHVLAYPVSQKITDVNGNLLVDRDWRTEFIVNAATRGPAGAGVRMGFMNALGMADFCYWSYTGASGTWWVNYQPTGAAGITSINTNIDPGMWQYTGAQFAAHAMECRGVTCTAEVNGVVVAAFPRPSIPYVYFGVKATGAVATGMRFSIDKMEYAVRRT